MKSYLGIILPAMVAVCTANATPTLYPTDLNWVSSVQNKTTSGLVADDADLHKIWVLPPNVATASVGTIESGTTHTGFCREMGDLQKNSRSMTGKILQLTEQMVAEKEMTDKLLVDLAQARKAAATFATEKHLQPLLDLDDRIRDLEDRLTELYKTSDTCKKNCDEIGAEINDVEQEKRGLAQDRRKLAQEHAADVRAYDKKKAVVDAISLNYQDAFDFYTKMNARLMSIRKDFLEMYSSFAGMHGSYVNFTYTSDWDENLANLRRTNPGFQFEKIVTQNAKVFASSLGAKDIPGDRAILDYGIPGVKKDGYVELASGFPDALEAKPLLSLVGTCPLLHPEYFDLDAGNGPNRMSYGLTVAYEFPAAMKLQATAKYNMYKMYQKIVSSGSSGGFFSSRSWTNVEERSFFKDSFHVDWTSQDPENAVNEENRLATEHEMRAHIMERLASLALPSAPDRAGIIAANAPPAHGAVVIASSLTTACPGNIYCVAGAAILTSLDAIFGSGSSTASYLQTQDFELTETWSNSKVVMKPWITSYISTEPQR